MKSEPKIAFVTDALPLIGGAEKAVFAALEAFPQADIFALIYNKDAFAGTPIACRQVTASYLNRLPFVPTYYRALLPLMPRAVEGFELGGYDLVVSFSYAVANGARVPDGARHISYTYSPMRYAWRDLSIDGKSRGGPFFDWVMQEFRKWDRAAAARVHAFAAISEAVRRRVQQAYGRDSRVIYPPVELERFHPAEQREEYYVTVSRLVAHKRIDLLVDAFSQLGLPLVVIGDGPERQRLERRAGPTVEFLGYQPDAVVAECLGKARAFVSAAEEDFGIAIVEAQAAGCPVLAYGKGGALETVEEMKTGVFFHEQTAQGLIDCIRQFEGTKGTFTAGEIARNALRFSKERFKREFLALVKGG
jgi:glycosyltransferase involved in cell wall biosynthesis